MSNSGFVFLGILGAIFAVIGVIIAIVLYIFFALSLSKLAKKRGMEMPWLAWVPVAQFYLIGLMVKSVKVSTFEIPKLEIVFPVAFLVYLILGAIPVLGFLIFIAYYALMIIILYNLYNQYTPEKAKLYAGLSILGITVPFLINKISDMEPVNLP